MELKQSPVSVYGMGGTIAASSDASGRLTPQVSTGDLLRRVTALPEHVRLHAIDVRQVPSTELVLEDMLSLARRMERDVRRGTVGVVVTQGTDTLEESAFALHLLWRLEAPVVVTGAMRGVDDIDADGPANLSAAIRVALSERARGLGCLVVHAGQIHTAAWVQKAHTSSLGAFQSPGRGAVGEVHEGHVYIWAQPTSSGGILDSPDSASVPNVALHTVTMGDTGVQLAGLRDLGFDGLVVEAMGGGHVPSVMEEGLRFAIREGGRTVGAGVVTKIIE